MIYWFLQCLLFKFVVFLMEEIAPERAQCSNCSDFDGLKPIAPGKFRKDRDEDSLRCTDAWYTHIQSKPAPKISEKNVTMSYVIRYL